VNDPTLAVETGKLTDVAVGPETASEIDAVRLDVWFSVSWPLGHETVGGVVSIW
jgi:hypothetical protein